MAYYDPIAWDGISGLDPDALAAKTMLETPRRLPAPPQVGEKGFARSFLQPGESIAYGTFRGTGRNTAPRVDIPAGASPGSVLARLEMGRRPRPPLPGAALAGGFGPAPAAAGAVQRAGPGRMARLNAYSQNPQLDPAALDAIERVVDAEAGVSGVAEVSPAELRLFRETLPSLKDTQGTTRGLREIAARVESKVGREMETGRSVLEGLAGEDRARPAGDYTAAAEKLSPLTRGLGREAATRLSAALAPEREKQKEHLEKIKRGQTLAKWMGLPEDEIQAMSEGELEGYVEGLVQSGQLEATLTNARTAQAGSERADTAAAREAKNAAAAQAAATSEDKVKAYVTAGGDDPQVIAMFQQEMARQREESKPPYKARLEVVKQGDLEIPVVYTSDSSAVPAPARFEPKARVAKPEVTVVDGIKFYRNSSDDPWRQANESKPDVQGSIFSGMWTNQRLAVLKQLEAIAVQERRGNKKFGPDIFPGQTYSEKRQRLEKELADLNAALARQTSGAAADSSGTNGEQNAPREFASEAAAEAAGLPAGTIVTINGRRARIK